MSGLPYAELIDWIRLARTPASARKISASCCSVSAARPEAIAHMPEWTGRQKQADVPLPAVAEKTPSGGHQSRPSTCHGRTQLSRTARCAR